MPHRQGRGSTCCFLESERWKLKWSLRDERKDSPGGLASRDGGGSLMETEGTKGKTERGQESTGCLKCYFEMGKSSYFEISK